MSLPPVGPLKFTRREQTFMMDVIMSLRQMGHRVLMILNSRIRLMALSTWMRKAATSWFHSESSAVNSVAPVRFLPGVITTMPYLRRALV